MKELMGKKGSMSQNNDMALEAKRDVIRQMRDIAMEEMGDGLRDGLKKVSVMAPDKEHLSEGLDKAKELISQMPGDNQQMPEMEASDEMDEFADMSPEELDEMIKRLEEMKQMKMRS